MYYQEIIRNECGDLLENDVLVTYEDCSHTYLLGKIRLADGMSLETALGLVEWNEEEMTEAVGGVGAVVAVDLVRAVTGGRCGR